jgi:hypothetical protein
MPDSRVITSSVPRGTFFKITINSVCVYVYVCLCVCSLLGRLAFPFQL